MDKYSMDVKTTLYLSIYLLIYIQDSPPPHITAKMNNTAMNICVQLFSWIYVFISLRYIIEMEKFHHMFIQCLHFEEISSSFPKHAILLSHRKSLTLQVLSSLINTHCVFGNGATLLDIKWHLISSFVFP